MTDPHPPTPVEQPSLGYQPISGWAISGFVVAALFAFLVAVCAVVALVLGTPVFFPMWFLLVAVAGGVLSWIGLTHVQNSEGTRVGAKLARIGIWLSLVSGLCYFSYWYFTGRAVQDQANAFLMEIGEDSGFFSHLKKGATDPREMNAAFLLTLPAVERQNVRPENEPELRRRFDKPTKDGAPGKLTLFRDNTLVRLLDLPPDVEVFPLEVLDWKYEGRKYQVKRMYRIKTTEMAINFAMVVERTEAENAGESSKWFVNLEGSHPMTDALPEYTPAGNALKVLRADARDQLNRWFKALDQGQLVVFADLDQTKWETLRLADVDRARAREAVRKHFESGVKNRFSDRKSPQMFNLGRWEQTPEGKLRIADNVRFPIELRLAPGGDGPGAAMSGVDCQIVLETKTAVDLARFELAPVVLDWNVIRIVIVNVSPIAAKA